VQLLAGAGDVLGTGAGVVVAEQTDSSEENKTTEAKTWLQQL
jgi:hypothetical protein